MAKRITDDISEFTRGDSLIEDERMRQCSKGFGRENDDARTDGSLLRCAMDVLVGVAADESGHVPDAPEWVEYRVEHINKKYTRAPIKRLVIAASLIVAEIERLQRVAIAAKKIKPRRAKH